MWGGGLPVMNKFGLWCIPLGPQTTSLSGSCRDGRLDHVGHTFYSVGVADAPTQELGGDE